MHRHGAFVHKNAGDIMFEPADFSTRYPFVLSEFRGHGWIRIARRHIDILDSTALRSFLERQ